MAINQYSCFLWRASGPLKGYETPNGIILLPKLIVKKKIKNSYIVLLKLSLPVSLKITVSIVAHVGCFYVEMSSTVTK